MTMSLNQDENYLIFVEQMKPHADKESDYRLPVHLVVDIGLMIFWHGLQARDDSMLHSAKVLLHDLGFNHPETRKIIEDYFKAIKTPEE
jgi:hypothetical protein